MAYSRHSLFAPDIWVTETDLEAIMGSEAGKQFCLKDLAHDPAVRTYRVVEDKKDRDAADIIEGICTRPWHTHSAVSPRNIWL